MPILKKSADIADADINIGTPLSIFNLEFQPKFGIQLGIPISMGINLGECSTGIHYLVEHPALICLWTVGYVSELNIIRIMHLYEHECIQVTFDDTQKVKEQLD